MGIIHQKQSISMSRTVVVLGTFVLSLSGSMAYAGTQCYDFSNPPVGTKYAVGETVNARHSKINLQQFMTVNGPSQSGVQEAEVIQSNIAQGGSAPSLKLTSVVAQVIPHKRVKEITMKYAENVGISGQHDINLGANGERRVWHGTLDQLDGQVLGKQKFGGKVRVSVTADPVPGGYWRRGTLTLTSLGAKNPLFPNKGIQVMAMGQPSQLVVDDFCATE